MEARRRVGGAPPSLGVRACVPTETTRKLGHWRSEQKAELGALSLVASGSTGGSLVLGPPRRPPGVISGLAPVLVACAKELVFLHF